MSQNRGNDGHANRYGNWREQPLIGSPGIEYEAPAPARPATTETGPRSQPGGAKPVALHADEPLIGHEPDVINTRPIWLFLIGVAVFGLFAFVAVTALQIAVSGTQAQFRLPDGGVAPLPSNPIPRDALARADPSLELREITAEADDVLTSFGWVDQAAGVVRIPIDKAMELTLQRGLPTRPNAGPFPAAPLPLDSSSGRTVSEAEGQK